ncbi:MAG TPA: hypothetical protein VJ733_06810 [Candidatus Binatia bacterium]|nr:hypothetical protein [Candidatus Binatia bacterium]
MKRKIISLFFILACMATSFACSAPLTYSAKEIHGQIVGTDTNQPIEGAIVVAQWVLFHIGPGHGGHKSRIHIHETMTDKNGNYMIPAWGPKLRPPMTELHERDPQLSIFKSNYEPLGLSNTVISSVRHDSLRVSEWDGKVIKLTRTKQSLEDQAFRLSSFYGGLEYGSSGKDWYNYPRMLLALYAEKARLQSLGLKPGHAGSIPNMRNFSESDRHYLKRFEK